MIGPCSRGTLHTPRSVEHWQGRELDSDLERGLTHRGGATASRASAQLTAQRCAAPVRGDRSPAVRRSARRLAGRRRGHVRIDRRAEYDRSDRDRRDRSSNAGLGFAQEARRARRARVARRAGATRKRRPRRARARGCRRGRRPGRPRRSAEANVFRRTRGSSQPRDWQWTSPRSRGVGAGRQDGRAGAASCTAGGAIIDGHAGSAVTRGRARAVVTATGLSGRPHRRHDSAGRAATHAAPAPRARAVASDGRSRDRRHTHPRRAMLAQGSTFEEAFLVGSRSPSQRCPRDSPRPSPLALGARAMAARGASAPADRSRDPGQRDGDRLRQDGDAHREPAAGRRAAAGFKRGRTASSSRRFSRRAHPVEGGELGHTGDPVDDALVLAAREQGLSPEALTPSGRLIRELPSTRFESA